MAKGTATPSKVQKQNEEAARLKAERLTAAADPVKPDDKPAEPTLEQRLDDIKRRHAKMAADEQSALAGQYLNEATAEFRRAVSNTTDETVKAAYERVEHLRKISGGGTGHPAFGPLFGGSVKNAGEGEGKTRIKRNAESLKADAEKIAEYLKENPNSPASKVKEIADFGISIKDFVEKYTSHNVKTSGDRRSMTYSLAH